MAVAVLLLMGQPGDGGDRWATFVSNEAGLRFRYPASLLTISEQERAVILSHRVAYGHRDPCNMSDKVGFLDDVVDFDVRVSLEQAALPDVFEKTESDYVTSRFLKAHRVVTSRGFIDEVEVGSLRGYRVTTGVEGCGLRRYYLRIDEGRTLLVDWMNVPEFDRTYRDTVLALENIILPDRAAEVFEAVVSSCTPLD